MATKAKQVDFLLSQVRNSVGSLAGGTITFYAAGGTTLKTIWLDRDKVSVAANPYTLDANGTAQLYADGSYKILIKNAAGSQIFLRDNLFFHYEDNLYEIDALDVYGGGTSFTKATIDAALAVIGGGGATQYTLLLRPGTWVMNANANYSAHTNVIFKIVPGAILQIATGTTTTLPWMDETGSHKRFDCVGTGVVAFNTGAVKEVCPNWWATNTTPGTTDMSTAINLAINTTSPVRLLPSNYHVDSSVVIKEGSDLLGSGNSQSGTIISANSAIVILKSYAVGSGISEGYYGIKDLRIIGSSDLPTIGMQLGKTTVVTYDIIIDNVTVQGCLTGAQLNAVAYSSVRDLTVEGDAGADATYIRGLDLNATSSVDFINFNSQGFVNNLYMLKSGPTFNKGSIWAEAAQTHTTSLAKIVNSRDAIFNGVIFENNMGDMDEILFDSTDTSYETNNIMFNNCSSIGSGGASNTATRFVIGVNAGGHFDVMNTVLNHHKFNWTYYVTDVDVTSGKADGVTLNKCVRREGFYGEFVLNPSVIGNLSTSKVHIIPAEEFWAANPSSASLIAHPWELGTRVYQSDALLSGTDGNQGWVVARPGSVGGGYSPTGNTDGATAVITGLSLTHPFPVGNYVSVTAGFPTTGPYKIIVASDNSITLDTNSNAAVIGITISEMDPVFGKMGGYKLIGSSANYNPTVNAGATTSQNVTVTGAVFANIASASHDNGFNGLMYSANVSAADTVTVTLYNPTGAPITIANGTLRACVEKRPAT